MLFRRGRGVGLVLPVAFAFMLSAEPARAQCRGSGGQTSRADRLGADVTRTSGGRQAGLIRQLQDAKGAPYTAALVGAIHKLDAKPREQARDALAERLTRMTAATLRTYL